MSRESGWSNISDALNNRNYRTYQGGRFLSQITIWMYKVTIGWMVWDMTQSAAWLGVFGVLDHAPALFIMPIAGALADRMDSLKFIRITQAILMVQALVLSLLVALDLINLTVLIAFSLSYGVVNAAQQPAGQSIIPKLLSRQNLTAAYGLNSLSFNISRFIGPMIAGLIITQWGTAPAIFSNAIGATIFSVALIYTKISHTLPQRPHGASTHMLRDIQDGFRYASRHPGIGPSMAILTLLSILPFSIDLLLPSLADGVYKAGANGLAWMTSMMGVGAMVQAIVIARRGRIAGLTRNFVIGIAVLAVAVVALAFSPNLWTALICIFLIGYTSSLIRVSGMTLLQYGVDADMRGRVASFYSVISHTGPAVASLVVGLAGDRFGLPPTLMVIGILTFAIWIWGLQRQKAIEHSLEREPVEVGPAIKEPPRKAEATQ